VTLNVANPKAYTVGSSEISEFLLNDDGTFVGVVKSGTTVNGILVTEKEGQVDPTKLNMVEFLPGVYDVHVTLNVANPEDYKVFCNGKEFKYEDGVFKGPCHTSKVTVENFVVIKKEVLNNEGGKVLE
jgi:hypothetical protein